MQKNSEHLAHHLLPILRLNIDPIEDEPEGAQQLFDPDTYLMDYEIHQLPICISIDGSYGEDGIATTTI